MFLNFHGDAVASKDLKFFFIFCPNNSGKTILSQYLAAQLGGFLPASSNNEGQMMRDVKDMMRSKPWLATSEFDWPFIRRVWQKKAAGRIFVEASPPNMMRSAAIEAQFGRDSTAMFSICSPYQHVASVLKRYMKLGTAVNKLALAWVMKAQRIHDLTLRHPYLPLIRYEDFVLNPALVNARLDLPVVPFTGVGKLGSGATALQDLSIRTTMFLNATEIDIVSKHLSKHLALLCAFGYHLTSGADMIAASRAENAAEYDIARSRRAEWDLTPP